jgi:tryptophan synthase alpha subunit
MLKDIMETIGKKGYHVTVRYDPLRDEKMFTVYITQGYPYKRWRTDTDEPVEILIKLLEKGLDNLELL